MHRGKTFHANSPRTYGCTTFGLLDLCAAHYFIHAYVYVTGAACLCVGLVACVSVSYFSVGKLY